MSLEELRAGIDGIDKRIVGLLDDRADVARRIAEEKIRLGLPLRSPEREEAVLRGLAAASSGSMPAAGLVGIYRRIMEETLALEERSSGEAAGASRSPCRDREGKDVMADVLENSEAASGFFRMRLRVPGRAVIFEPGQFFQLRVLPGRSEPFLRRPFAPSEMTGDGLAFVYAVAGAGTRLMAGLRPGARVGVLAPLGRGYTLVGAGSEAVLVGGGCGGPSLAPLAARLAAVGVRTTAVLGARTAASLLGIGELSRHARRLVVATDDGSRGFAGNAVAALEHALGDAVPRLARLYACGPVPMLAAVARLAARHGVSCEVSLEERMACGFGACVGCVVETAGKDGKSVFRRVCRDGPVFDARDLPRFAEDRPDGRRESNTPAML